MINDIVKLSNDEYMNGYGDRFKIVCQVDNMFIAMYSTGSLMLVPSAQKIVKKRIPFKHCFCDLPAYIFGTNVYRVTKADKIVLVGCLKMISQDHSKIMIGNKWYNDQTLAEIGAIIYPKQKDEYKLYSEEIEAGEVIWPL